MNNDGRQQRGRSSAVSPGLRWFRPDDHPLHRQRVRVIVAALARACHDLDGPAPDLDSALRKFDSWAAPTGCRFTVVTGDDALRVRSPAQVGRRPHSQARAAMSREQHAQLPHTGDPVRAIHEQHGPGTLTLTVKSSRFVTGTFAAGDGSVHDAACTPRSALRWIAGAQQEASESDTA